LLAVCLGSPVAPGNGTFACGASSLPGTTCNSTCLLGYKGAYSSTCGTDGVWGNVTGACGLIGKAQLRNPISSGGFVCSDAAVQAQLMQAKLMQAKSCFKWVAHQCSGIGLLCAATMQFALAARPTLCMESSTVAAAAALAAHAMQVAVRATVGPRQPYAGLMGAGLQRALVSLLVGQQWRP